MDDAPASLRLILADPDADGPRLVYADWLDEHGGARRAGVIRRQCAFRAPPDDAHSPPPPPGRRQAPLRPPGARQYPAGTQPLCLGRPPARPGHRMAVRTRLSRV